MPIVQPRAAAPPVQPEVVAPVAYERAPATRTSPAPAADAPEADDTPAPDRGATVSAAPQLRNYQRDATAFVPTSVRKRQRQR